jgi:hypothetical protein
MVFMRRKIHFEDHWNGWALKIATFLGPEMATNKASAICAQVQAPYKQKGNFVYTSFCILYSELYVVSFILIA